METNRYLELQRKLSDFYFKKVQPKLASYNQIRKDRTILTILTYGLVISFVLLLITSLIPVINIITGTIFAIFCLCYMIKNLGQKNINRDIEHEIKFDLMDGFVKIFGDLHWYNDRIINKDNNDKIFELQNKMRNKSANYRADFIENHPEYKEIKERYQQQMKQIWNDWNKVKALNLFKFLSLEFDDCIDGTYENIPFSIKEVKTIPPIFLALGCLPVLLFFGPIALIVGIIVLLIVSSLISDLYDNFISTLIKLGASKSVAALIAATILVLSIKFIFSKFRSASTSFKGVIVEFAMNKDFEGHTFILDNTKDGKAISVDKNKYSEVKLEDVEFAKNYTVWTNNQIEARYLLTTAFIERLKSLKTSFKAEYTRVSFKDNKIVIAVHTGRDMFKMADMFTETGKETFIELFKEISSVLDIIDQLKLNQKLGL